MFPRRKPGEVGGAGGDVAVGLGELAESRLGELLELQVPVLTGELGERRELVEPRRQIAQAALGATRGLALRRALPGAQEEGDGVGLPRAPCVGLAQGERDLGGLCRLRPVAEEGLEKGRLPDAALPDVDGSRVVEVALLDQPAALGRQPLEQRRLGLEQADFFDLGVVVGEQLAIVARQRLESELPVPFGVNPRQSRSRSASTPNGQALSAASSTSSPALMGGAARSWGAARGRLPSRGARARSPRASACRPAP